MRKLMNCAAEGGRDEEVNEWSRVRELRELRE